MQQFVPLVVTVSMLIASKTSRAYHTVVYDLREQGEHNMARDTSPIVKQSRREGYALHPKAHKIMAKKTGIPGQHAHGRQGKPSLYLTQLREKQKVRRTYGLLEKQFARL